MFLIPWWKLSEAETRKKLSISRAMFSATGVKILFPANYRNSVLLQIVVSGPDLHKSAARKGDIFYSSCLKFCVIKGTVAWDGFLTIPLYLRYRIRILIFFLFVKLWLHLAYLESAPRFFNNHVRCHLISEPSENKMQLKFLACLTEKFHSAYSPYALNEINLALTQ